MIVKHLHRVHELLSVLNEPTFEMPQLRRLLTENERYPTRRTWERRLKGLSASLPAKIGCFGVYDWTLDIARVVAVAWIPLSAELTAANVADNGIAPALISALPADILFVLSDLHYNAPNVREVCEQTHRLLLATQYDPYPHTDAGVEVRSLFQKLRSPAIENFNEHFNGIFDGHGQVPTKGLFNTQRFGLDAIFVYQLALLYRFQHGLDLNVGLKTI